MSHIFGFAPRCCIFVSWISFLIYVALSFICLSWWSHNSTSYLSPLPLINFATLITLFLPLVLIFRFWHSNSCLIRLFWRAPLYFQRSSLCSVVPRSYILTHSCCFLVFVSLFFSTSTFLFFRILFPLLPILFTLSIIFRMFYICCNDIIRPFLNSLTLIVNFCRLFLELSMPVFYFLIFS